MNLSLNIPQDQFHPLMQFLEQCMLGGAAAFVTFEVADKGPISFSIGLQRKHGQPELLITGQANEGNDILFHVSAEVYENGRSWNDVIVETDYGQTIRLKPSGRIIPLLATELGLKGADVSVTYCEWSHEDEYPPDDAPSEQEQFGIKMVEQSKPQDAHDAA